MTPIEELPELERLGSARRAAIGMAATTAIMLLVGVPTLDVVSGTVGDIQGGARWLFSASGSLVLLFAALLAIPVISFTAGRLMDRRSASWQQSPVVRFAVVGALLGVVPALAWNLGAVPALATNPKIAAISFVFYTSLCAISGAGGRLLFELAVASRGWRITVWALYAIALIPAVVLLGSLVTSGAN